MTVPVFSAPCYDMPFKLAVNTSDTGVCAVLLQFYPMSYFFVTRNVMIKKEAVMLVMALEHFKFG